jgi:hypothetical protein
MQIYLFGLALLVLAGLLVLIVRKLIAMIRQRRALIAIGPIEWQGWLPPAENAEAEVVSEVASETPPVADTAPIADTAPGAGAGEPSPNADRNRNQSGFGKNPGKDADDADLSVTGMAPQRRRHLVSLLEDTKPGARIWPILPGYFKEVEGRLETAFEALCDERIDLAEYMALIDKEYNMALRQRANLGPLADDALHGEADDVIAALSWCQDWARKQHRVVSDNLPGGETSAA